MQKIYIIKIKKSFQQLKEFANNITTIWGYINPSQDGNHNQKH